MPSAKSGTAGTAVTPADPATAQEADQANPGGTAQFQAQPIQTQAGQSTSVQVKPGQSQASPSSTQPGQSGAGQSTSTQTTTTQAGQDDSAQTKPFKPPTTNDEKKTKISWIEIELVNEKNQPVAGETYRITLPDQTVADGTLDENGFARVEGFEPGACKVTFPNLDQDAWEDA
jgi:hypothetical protein